jgi:hypothetical protein
MVENIRLLKRNMTRIGGYFYSFEEVSDSMVQKTDDGTLAFSYPLDTPITREIISLEYDGESFWTQEHLSGTPADGFKIQRWVIENFVMVLQDTFEFDTDVTDTFESNAMTIENYEATVTNPGSAGTSEFNASSFPTDVFAQITPGTRMFLGPSSHASYTGQSESVIVSSTLTDGSGKIYLTAPLSRSFISPDKVVFSKNIWFFNEHFLKQADVGGLYKASSLDGSVLGRTLGGAFLLINAAAFADLSKDGGTFPAGDLAVYNKPSYLIFVRTNQLLFIDVLDSNLTTALSALQNNLHTDTVTVFDVYDLAQEGDTIFRLQEDFNIAGSVTSNAYNYQLATFDPFPTAIAITAVPAILPAANAAATSDITATVTDQYLLPFVTDPVSTITFGVSGGGAGSDLPTGPFALDANGQKTVVYTSGADAGLVTITAEVTIGT